MRTIFIEIIIFCYLAILMTSCTLSFQNISTHGVATDLVDENQAATADVKPNLNMPLR